VDYRGLNKVTIRNRHPLPLISETLDWLSRAKRFTKFNLRDVYHRIHIKRGDEWKTAFYTRYSYFEYTVMPFGLINAPATFQSYINKALRGYLDIFYITYLDDIMVYSERVEDHEEHVRKVLERL
jgi:Reverse transcriptase (RNA-dependent DNA polymerase)